MSITRLHSEPGHPANGAAGALHESAGRGGGGSLAKAAAIACPAALIDRPLPVGRHGPGDVARRCASGEDIAASILARRCARPNVNRPPPPTGARDPAAARFQGRVLEQSPLRWRPGRIDVARWNPYNAAAMVRATIRREETDIKRRRMTLSQTGRAEHRPKRAPRSPIRGFVTVELEGRA